MKAYHKNPRTITKDKYERLSDTLSRLGDLGGIVHNLETDEVIGGNQRMSVFKDGKVEITQQLAEPDDQGTVGHGFIIWGGHRFAYRQVRWDEKTAEEANIAANVGAGQWNWDLLANEFDASELIAWGLNKDMLKEWRHDANAIEALLESEEHVADAEPQTSAADVLQRKWQVAPGEVWQIGPHHLACGDATDRAAVERLMGRDKGDMVYIDPPYGISYVGVNNPNGRKWQMLTNDNLTGGKLLEFLTPSFTNLYNVTKDNVPLYCWHAPSNQMVFEQALNAAGWTVRKQLVWNRGMTLGHSDYHWSHEPMFYCSKTGHTLPWYGDRSQKTVLGARRTDIIRLSKQDLMAIVLAMIDNATTWEIDRDSVLTYQHPTQKPTRLALRAIANSSAPGGIVVDTFGGSGTTLIACHNLNRICRMMEIAPEYCSVVLQRAEDAFGLTGERITNG